MNINQRTTETRPYGLRINLRRKPWGIPSDPGTWRFSWIVSGEQCACRIVISRGESDKIFGTEYDSRWIDGNRHMGVALPDIKGRTFAAGLYSWQVIVRRRDGQELASDIQPFSVFDDSEWGRARGIWPQTATSSGDCVPGVCGFVRQGFSLSQDALSRTAHTLVSVTARSPETARQFVCTLYINGVPLLAAPPRYGRDPQGHRLLFVMTADMTTYLRVGENVVAALLSCPGEQSVRMFSCRAVAYGADGTPHDLLSPDGWRGLDGTAALRPRHSIGTGYFTAYAQNIDGSVYPFGYAEPGFDDSAWLPCDVKNLLSAGLSEGEKLLPTPAGCDSVSWYKWEKMPRVLEMGEGHYLVDLGQEIVGNVSLDVPDLPDWRDGADAGSDTVLYMGEQLRPAPSADGTIVKWEMNTGNRYRFVWRLVPGKQYAATDMMTFRFVELVGLPFALTPDMICGMTVRRQPEEERSCMACSSPLLRNLWQLVYNTVELTTQDIYVDSQSRERGAYEGDALINQLAAYSMGGDYATARFSLEYLYAHRTWPAEYILWITEAAYEDYLATGDDSSLRQWYPVLREKTFTAFKDEGTGLLHSGNAGSSGTDAVLVDWPQSERDGYDMNVRYNTVLNCAAVAGYTALARIADAIGEVQDGREFAERAESLRDSVIAQLYDPETGDFSDGLYPNGERSAHVSQHAAAYALYASVYRGRSMADRIVERLWERSLRPDAGGSRIRMSVYGTYFLLMGLYRAGHGDMANSLLLDEDDRQGQRTFSYMLHRAAGDFPSPFDGRPIGATLTTEAWNTANKPNMTFSHPWGSAAAVAVVRGIFGVNPTAPGYETFTQNTQAEILAGDSAISGELSLPTMCGTITVKIP